MKKYFVAVGLLAGLVLLWVRYSQWYITVDIPFLQNQESSPQYMVDGTLEISPYGVEDVVLDFLSDAKYTLRMREYSITMREVISVLKNKATMGADVRILLENRTYGNSQKNWNEFKQKILWTPIKLRNDAQLWTNFVHAKTIVTDTHALFSTANLGYQWFWKNREYRFITDDESVVTNLQTLHQKDREAKTIHPIDIHPAIWYCPINCRSKLTKMIHRAQESIRIEAQYLEDPLLIQQLMRRQKEWISVEIIVGKNQEEDAIEWLEWVRVLRSTYLHAKNILIDETEFLITSMNLSTNAIENNREIGILTDNKRAIWSFVRQFERDWSDAQEI